MSKIPPEGGYGHAGSDIAGAEAARTRAALVIVTSLFFAWGFITSLLDPLVAAVKGIFSLNDVEAQLSASAFFIAYGLVSFPAAALLSRLRPARTVLLAFALMIVGCLVMLIATNKAMYPLVLTGLLVLASGITILQVAANPLVVSLGPPEHGHFRLTLSQAFNSVGTFVGPYVGAVLFLEGLEAGEGASNSPQARASALAGIDTAFLWIAGLLVALAVFFAAARRLVDAAAVSAKRPVGIGATIKEVVSSRWALLGGGAIFLYVGAEVAIGTQMALFLHGDDILAIPLQDAGKLVSLYWGGAMVGRLVGSVLLTRIHAPLLLSIATAMACGVCLYIFVIGGTSAGYAALVIGLFNSVMFPLIFSLTLGRSKATPEATSGFLCFAIVGGAAIPPLVGLVSQHTSYAHAFIVPAACYALLCAFAVACGRARTHAAAPTVSAIH